MNTPVLSGTINTKLGSLIHGWSLPAVDSCPGSTGLCRARCYGCRSYYCMPKLIATLQQNLAFSRTQEFVPWIISALRAAFARVLRIHVTGDFYEEAYVAKWLAVVRQLPSTVFYAYTRSWRCPEQLPLLVRLSREPNVRLWWSTDRQSGPGPAIRGIRTAYMAINDLDAQTAQADADLVFRDAHPSQKPRWIPMKHANGVLVCPVENGIVGKLHHTCSSCGLCWRQQRGACWEGEVKQLLTV